MKNEHKHQTVILNSALYQSEGFNDTGEAIVTEIPVEAVSNSYLERVMNATKPCTGRWIPNISALRKKKGKHDHKN